MKAECSSFFTLQLFIEAIVLHRDFTNIFTSEIFFVDSGSSSVFLHDTNTLSNPRILGYS